MVTFIKYPMSEFRNDWADLLQLRSNRLKNDVVGQSRRRYRKYKVGPERRGVVKVTRFLFLFGLNPHYYQH